MYPHEYLIVHWDGYGYTEALRIPDHLDRRGRDAWVEAWRKEYPRVSTTHLAGKALSIVGKTDGV